MSRRWPRGSPSPPGGWRPSRSRSKPTAATCSCAAGWRSTVPQTCGRCAEVFPQRVEADVDVRAGAAAGAAATASSWAPTISTWTSTHNDQLDLTRIVETETRLALPMKPLCRTRLPGPVSRVRGQPQRRIVRVRVSARRTRVWPSCATSPRACPTESPKTGERNSFMPLPKRRHSRARGRKRRTHYKLAAPTRVGVSAVPGGQACRTGSARTAATTRGGRSSPSKRYRVALPMSVRTPARRACNPMKIAVDAMGGDHGPAVVVEGAVAAVREFGASVVLVGDRTAIETRDSAPGRPESRPRDPPRLRGGRHGREPLAGPASQARLLAARGRRAGPRRQGRRVHLGRQHRARPWPSRCSSSACCGASIARPSRRCCRACAATRSCSTPAPTSTPKPWHLFQFAIMGHVYARDILGLERPRVGLLSVGEEEGKGNDLTREAYELLKESSLNFIGNVEGRDIYNGQCDVDRHRRLHRQRRAQDLREPGRDGRRHDQGRADARPALAGGRGAGAAGVPRASASASTTRRWAGRRCWASTGPPSSATGRRR